MTGWALVLAAARHAEHAGRADLTGTSILDAHARLGQSADPPEGALLVWTPSQGWVSQLTAEDPRRDLVDLYLPLCSARSATPVTVGHLGQSLDGFIATHLGDSRWVTGQENILHVHRMRALCDAVVVGARTVAADDPQLTTRHVDGPNPLRVIFDPTRRLDSRYAVFTDEAAPTLYVCATSLIKAGETHVGYASIVGVDTSAEGSHVAALVQHLRDRECRRVLVEGGGITVSRFLEANLLDRLHLAVAPVLIGNGRPAIRLAPSATLDECRRPQCRVFRMGSDILFDCDLTAAGEREEADTPFVRII